MLKKLNKKEVQAFTNMFEIRCKMIVIESDHEEYFLTIDESKKFKVSKELINKIY